MIKLIAGNSKKEFQDELDAAINDGWTIIETTFQTILLDAKDFTVRHSILVKK